MSFYPAEHYQSNDDDDMHSWSNYTYQQSTQPAAVSSPTDEKHSLDDGSFSWPIPQHPYTSSQPMPWPSENRALDLDSLQTPTQAMFSNASSALSTPNVTSSWPLPFAPIPQTNCTQGDSQQDQSYPTSSALTDHTQWRPLHQMPTSQAYSFDAPASHGSPAQSDHSESSYSSLIASSPYAQSDGYFQTGSPPSIKLEDSFDRSQSSLYSIPGTTAREELSHVDPTDIFAQATNSAAYQDLSRSSTAATQCVKDEYHDVKYDDSHGREGPTTQRPLDTSTSIQSLSHMSEAEARFKRGYTTMENSTCHCPHCGKLFQRSYNLKAHLETHDPNRDQPHVCEYAGCKRKFVRKTDLTRHEQSVHLKARNFACSMCNNAFARKDTLRRHVEDGCPLRPEIKRRINRRRSSASNSSNLHYGASQRYDDRVSVIKTE